MNDYLKSITPDSFSGMLFALEGIDGAMTLLNGPTGCKFYHSATADYQTIRQLEYDPLGYPEQWYFGQPRVPCTYLDSRDYVYGSGGKLEEAIVFLRKNASFELLSTHHSRAIRRAVQKRWGCRKRACVRKRQHDRTAQTTRPPFLWDRDIAALAWLCGCIA